MTHGCHTSFLPDDNFDINITKKGLVQKKNQGTNFQSAKATRRTGRVLTAACETQQDCTIHKTAAKQFEKLGLYCENTSF